MHNAHTYNAQHPQSAVDREVGPTPFNQAQPQTLHHHPPPTPVQMWPHMGNYCVFDGRLGHGVLGSSATHDTRATLLVNWWTGQPRVRQEGGQTRIG